MEKEAIGADRLHRRFPTPAGFLFGLGLGGFFDGIVLHQILQWHHMLSAWYPISTLENLKLNNLWDGIFHSLTYIFVLAGLFILWRHARRQHLLWSTKLLMGSMLVGFGTFNLVEGLVDHHMLGVHHVNETVTASQLVYWDVAFLVWGAAMLFAGWHLPVWSARNSDGPQCGRSERSSIACFRYPTQLSGPYLDLA